MPISLNDLYKVLNKTASQAPVQDPGLQAMLLAALAAKPAGAPPLPKAIQQELPELEDSQLLDFDKEIQDRDKLLDSQKKENESLRHQLMLEKLQHQQEILLREVEKKERESIQRIKQQQEELDKQKTVNEAELIQHKAKLDKETAMAQVKLEQLKSKTLIDLSKQQALQEIQHIDRTRKNVDKYMQESIKKLDKEKLEFESSKKAVSPALQSIMDNALSSLNKIPTPGGLPLQLDKKANLLDRAKNLVNDGILLVTDPKLFALEQARNYLNQQLGVDIANCITDNDLSKILDQVTSNNLDLNNIDMQRVFSMLSDESINNLRNYSRNTSIQDSKPGDAVSLKISDATGGLVNFNSNKLLASTVSNMARSGGSASDNPRDLWAHLPYEYLLQISAAMADAIKNQDQNALLFIKNTLGADLYDLALQKHGININQNKSTPDKLPSGSGMLSSVGGFILPLVTADVMNLKISEQLGNQLMGGQSIDLGNHSDAATLVLTWLPDNKHNPILSESDLQTIVKNWDSISPDNKSRLGVVLSPKYRLQVGWMPNYAQNPNYRKNLLLWLDYYKDNNKLIAQGGSTVRDYYGQVPQKINSVYSKSPYDTMTNGLYSTVAPYVPLVGQAFGWDILMPGYSTPSLKNHRYKPVDVQGIAHEGNITFKDSRFKNIGLNSEITKTTPGGYSLMRSFNGL